MADKNRAHRKSHERKEEEFARAADIMQRLGDHGRVAQIAALKSEGVPRDVIEHYFPPEEPEEENKKSTRDMLRENLPILYGITKRHRTAVSSIIAIAILLFIVFIEQITALIFVLIMFVAASFSTYYKRKLGVPVGGFELVTFGSIICGALYGPWIGAIFGALALAVSSILAADVSPMTILGVGAMALGGLAAGLLYNDNLMTLGIGVNLGILVLSQGPAFLLGDEEIKASAIIYISTNLVSNILLLATLGQFVIRLLPSTIY